MTTHGAVRTAASIGAKAPRKLIGAASRTGGFAVASIQRAVHLRRNYPEVPIPAPNLARLATVFAEELMLLTAATTDSRVRDDAVLGRISDETDEALALFESNGWLDDPASYHQTPKAPKDFHLESREFARTRFERLSFDSGYQPRPGMPGSERWLSMEANGRCYAHVLEHTDGPRPWVVFVHGAGMGSPIDLFVLSAMGYHRDLGFNVLAPVLPLHGPRKNTGHERADVASIDWVANVHSLTQIVWDLRRCLAWIRARGAPSIAVHGMSLGGYATALLSGLDADLGCVIAGVPAATIHRPLISVYTHNPSFRKALEQHDLIGDRVEALHSVITPTSLECVVPHDRRFIYAGIADRLVTPNEPYLLWEHWNRPSIYWTQQSHVLTMLSPGVRTFVREAVIGSAATASPSPAPGRRVKPVASAT